MDDWHDSLHVSKISDGSESCVFWTSTFCTNYSLLIYYNVRIRLAGSPTRNCELCCLINMEEVVVVNHLKVNSSGLSKELEAQRYRSFLEKVFLPYNFDFFFPWIEKDGSLFSQFQCSFRRGLNRVHDGSSNTGSLKDLDPAYRGASRRGNLEMRAYHYDVFWKKAALVDETGAQVETKICLYGMIKA